MKRLTVHHRKGFDEHSFNHYSYTEREDYIYIKIFNGNESVSMKLKVPEEELKDKLYSQFACDNCLEIGIVITVDSEFDEDHTEILVLTEVITDDDE